jgi:hypothetical protein
MVLALLTLVACSENNVQKAQPNLTVDPAVVDFGGIVRTYSSTLDVRLLNGGLGKLELEGVEIVGEGAGFFEVGPLPTDPLLSDGEFALPVTFTPTEFTDYAATLTLYSNDEESPHTVVLTGSGIEAPRPDIALDTLSLDFGDVMPGTPAVRWFTVTNMGDDTLNIGVATQSGSGAFQVQGSIDGDALAPGQDAQVIVIYNPSALGGDNGSLTITSDDPDEGEVVVTFLGNGGGDFEYPVAVIDGPATALPRETLTLDGSESYDPAGYTPLTYHWTLEEVPEGSAAGDFFVLQTDTAYLQTDLAGDYAVTLQVENTLGILSAPARYRVTAIPQDQLHVELSWNTPSADLDLHLLNGEGSFFVNPDDCNWCNRSPSWGGVGGADDPSLDIDDLFGYGPENINIEIPAEDTYRVAVHYFEDNGDGDVVATVKIYAYGIEEGRFTKVLRRNQVWDVAEIRWPDGAVIEGTSAPYTAPRRGCD